MKKQYWHLLSDKEMEKIIKEKHKFSYLMKNYNAPDWCNHANPIAPSFFGCEKLMNHRESISLESCINCEHFKH